ncbi:unnamed protein product [Rhizophagus irregularis]|nr:unnamed protein product [Rhizophagus irregularis]
MDGERNLQRNLFNGSKLRRTVSLQYVFPSFQIAIKSRFHLGFLDSGQYIIDLEVMARRERWDHANCLEMNAWTHLSQVRPNIPIRTLTIDVADGTAKYPCLKMSRVNFLIN